MVRKIQHKRGPEKDLPRLEIAEWALTTDTEKPFIGAASGNVEIAKKKDVEAVSSEVSKKADAAEVTALGSQLADTEKFIDEYLNVEWFSPKGNANYFNPANKKWYEDVGFTIEATDDTAIIQTAFQYAIDNRLKGITFPKKNFLIKRNPNDATISFLIKEANHFKIQNNGAKFVTAMDISGGSISLFKLSGCKDTVFEGAEFEVLSQGTTAVRRNLRVIEVTAHQSDINVTSSPYVTSERVTISRNKFKLTYDTAFDYNNHALYGIWAHSPQESEEKFIRDIEIKNNEFNDSNGRLIMTYLVKGANIEKNNFYNCGNLGNVVCLRIIGASEDVNLLNNHIELSSGINNANYSYDVEGIRINGGVTGYTTYESTIPAKNIKVQGNTVKGKTRFTSRAFVSMIVSLVDGMLVSGNTFEGLVGDGDAMRGDHIRFTSTFSVPSKNIKIENNTFKSPAIWHMYVEDAGMTNITIENNSFSNALDGVARTFYDLDNQLTVGKNYYESIGLNTEITASAPPTTGYHKRGEIIKHNSPLRGRPLYWVCTESGTPGKWEPSQQLGYTNSIASAPLYIGQIAVFGSMPYISVGTSVSDWALLGREVAVPETATSTGRKGQTAADANYLYYCIADNTWVRTPVATW